MSILEFIESVKVYLMKVCSERFTGKICITINLHKGGIGNVQVSSEHALERVDASTHE
jgi:hypothetical protein